MLWCDYFYERKIIDLPQQKNKQNKSWELVGTTTTSTNKHNQKMYAKPEDQIKSYQKTAHDRTQQINKKQNKYWIKASQSKTYGGIKSKMKKVKKYKQFKVAYLRSLFSL